MDRQLDLPPPILEVAAQWGFEPEVELPEGYCCRAFADATRVLRWPNRGEEATFGVVAAVRLAAVGGPAIYAIDSTTGAMLMERLVPGTKLRDVATPSDTGAEIAIGLMARTRTLPGKGLLKLEDFYRPGHTGVREMTSTAPKRVFLHGDLHQENILRHGDGWRPIDPKGLWGDPHYEPVAFLRNLIDDWDDVDDLHGYLERHIRRFAQDLSLDPKRIARWLWIDAMDWRNDFPPTDRRHAFAQWVEQMFL